MAVSVGLCSTLSCTKKSGAPTPTGEDGPDADATAAPRHLGALPKDLSEISLTPKEKGAMRILAFGKKIPVDFNWAKDRESMTLELWADEERIDREVFAESAAGIALVDGSDSAFNPPIPLLPKSGAVTGSVAWKGASRFNNLNLAGEAKVSYQPDTATVGIDQVSGLRVQVDLTVDTGKGTSKRVFKYWFSPGLGLVKRDIEKGVSIERSDL
ncbi:MAG: hypothetical protein JSS72_07285 [Armatimonadetes bacterium]|nr:hypothetical protein [Armatimonadota bacterium]